MKIGFVRSGGIAGMRLELSLDTESLPPEEASRIRQLVESSGFFEVRQSELRSTVMPDRFEYQLEIKSQVLGEHALSFQETGAPEELQPLLQHLTILARQHGGVDRGSGNSSPNSD